MARAQNTVEHWSEAELRAEQEQSKAGAAHKCRGTQAGAEEYKLEHRSTCWSTGAQAHRSRVEQELALHSCTLE